MSGSITESVTEAINARLSKLGIQLPTPAAPAGAYQPIVIRNGIGFVSGQFPFVGGQLLASGRVGIELSEQQGNAAARIAAINVLAQIHNYFDGFDGFAGLLRVDGYVACAPGNFSQPMVLDGASDLFVAVLGADLGAHTRTAFSVAQLPLESPIELAVTFAADSERGR